MEAFAALSAAANNATTAGAPSSSSSKLKRLKTPLINNSSRKGAPGSSNNYVTTASEYSQQLQKLVHTSYGDELAARAQLFSSAESMVEHLPLKYLFSKPELRSYGLRRAAKILIKPALASTLHVCRQAFKYWHGMVYGQSGAVAKKRLNDRHIGVLVIAKGIVNLYERAMRKKFRYWATVYSSRYKGILGKRPTLAAAFIQRWFRHLRIVRRQPFRNLAEAVHICLHRRRAIKRAIEYERTRRQALEKVRRGITLRRRIHFAARSIQRVYRFIMMLRRMRWRLTRSAAARKIKGWRKRILTKRDITALATIRLVLRCGGLKAVKPKLPRRLLLVHTHQVKRHAIHTDTHNAHGQHNTHSALSHGLPHPEVHDPSHHLTSHLAGIPHQHTHPHRTKKYFSVIGAVNDCIRQIQRAWFKCCNKYAEFEALAAQRAKEAYEKMRNDMCTIIQNSYRAHLWNQLLKAAYQNLRAIRIQRGFRAHTYRVWVAQQCMRGRHHRVTRIIRCYRRFVWRQLMAERFKLREAMLLFKKASLYSAVRRVQRKYRRFILHMREWKEEQKRLYEEQKKQHGFMLGHICTIQRFYRQFINNHPRSNSFSTHVLRICKYVVIPGMRRKMFNAAFRIQKLARNYLRRCAQLLLVKQTAACMIAWKLTKAYLLKLAIHDRVLATRERRRVASNRIKNNIRTMLWWRFLSIRTACQREKLTLQRMKNTNATVINMFIRRKYIEHFAPLRVAGRRQLYKKRKAEAEERERQRIDRAARKVQKAFHGVVTWEKTLRLVDEQRIYFRRHNAAKTIQKFFTMVVAWARFRRAVDDKNARVAAAKQLALETKAANMVGWHFKRYREKKTLAVRFMLRKKMLDTYKSLDAAKEQAYERRDEAYEEVRKTEDSLAATIAASWRQGSDASGRNYYYNHVTG
jgi:hypothetical protein